MRRARWRYSFFAKIYFILLGVVFALCIICAITSIAVMRDYSNNQYGKASLAAAEGESATMTVLTDGMEREVIQLTMLIKQETNGTISKASFLSDTPASVLLRRNLNGYIGNLVNSNSKYSSIYLYLENPEYVITSEGKYTGLSSFNDLAWYEVWMQEQKKDGLWMGERTIHVRDSVTPVPVLTFICPLSAYIAPNIKGVVVFNISKTGICSLLNASGEQKTVFVDKDGQIMFNNIDEQRAGKVSDPYYQRRMEAGDGYFIDSQSNDMVCYTEMKNGSGWTLISFTGMQAGEQMITQSLRLLIIIIAGIFLISTLVVAFLTRKLSMPISRIREQLEKDERFQTAEPDEIRHIENALAFLQDEEKRLSSEVDKQREEKSRQFLFKLFTSESGADDRIADGCDSDTTELLSTRKGLTFFFSNDSSISQLTHYHGEELDQYQRLISRMFSDCFDTEDTIVLYIPLRRDFVLVVMRKESWSEEDNRNVVQRLQRIQEQINGTFQISYTIGISNLWTGAGSAHVSYTESREAARMKLLLGCRRIIPYSQVPDSGARLVYPSQTEQKFVNAIRIHDPISACKWVHDFLQEIQETRDMTVDNAMLATYIFLGTAVREINEEGYRSGIRLNETSQILDQVYYHSFDTLVGLEEFLMPHIKEIAEKLQKFSEENDNIINRIYSYIDQNYMNDIGIEELAENLGISYSYIRKVFKEATLLTIPDAINKKRISKAKELLMTTDLSMKAIAALIGYNTEQSFTRNFRKYENMLPSQYKSIQTSEASQ